MVKSMILLLRDRSSVRFLEPIETYGNLHQVRLLSILPFLISQLLTPTNLHLQTCRTSEEDRDGRHGCNHPGPHLLYARGG